ncbi:MAG: sugar phosphate nucleotidyltransferase, partial [Actinomycetota bacterium]|nr:sugar phosphate nucleotidyltransferase [Actinomycetota bacterium]
MKAVVMAGGQGTRLRPLTSNQPKPMLPVVGRPMMEHVLRLVRRHGLEDTVVTIQFLGSVIRNYFGDGADLGLSLEYALEDEPLGTAGSVKNAEALLDDPFLVISGDAVTDIDLSAAVEFHRRKGAAVTVVLQHVEDPLEFGIVIVDEEGRIERFLEKPGWGEVFSDTINTGIYVVEPEVLEYVPPDREYDFAKDLFPLLLDKGLPLYGYVADAYWTDVGNLDAYLEVHRDILERKVDLEVSGFDVGGTIWLGDGAVIDPDADVGGPIYVGENSRIESGSTVREYTVLGKGVVVKSGAFVHRAIVHDNAYIGSSVSLRGCVVGKNVDVKHGARLEEGVVVADESHVGEGAVLSPNVKVYPFKTVDPGALVTKSIVWESRATRGLFGERGISGLANIDITPEMALRLALAFAGTMPKASVAAACRDATRTARIVKRAMVVGLNAAGVDVHDLELVPVPVARFYARSTRASGGIAVRTSPYDPQAVEIEFFDGDGIEIDAGTQRAVDRAFHRDDVRRVFHHEIGELTFPARGREYYLRGLLDAVAVDVIRSSRPKVVVDYSFGGASLTGPLVLGRLGVDVLGVNAVLDEERVVLSREDTEQHLQQLAGLVRSSGATLGALVDSPGERVRLVDGRGRVVPLDRALLAYVELVSRVTDAPVVAIPVTTTRVVEDLVRARGGSVVWTRISATALSAAADQEGAVFGGAEGGGYLFPEFLPAYDALMSLVKLLELLSRTETTLEEVLDRLPPAHVVRIDVPIPWEAKGTVMRRLVEKHAGDEVVTIDGVK